MGSIREKIPFPRSLTSTLSRSMEEGDCFLAFDETDAQAGSKRVAQFSSFIEWESARVKVSVLS